MLDKFDKLDMLDKFDKIQVNLDKLGSISYKTHFPLTFQDLLKPPDLRILLPTVLIGKVSWFFYQ